PALAAAGIDTLAGSAGSGPATAVEQGPVSLLLRSGNVYVADGEFHVVRSIDRSTAQESVVAGVGGMEFSGDGGSALAAMFSIPTGLAMDPMGDLVIVDSWNQRVRRV